MRDWKARLDAFLKMPSEQLPEHPHVAAYELEASQFIKDVVWPAFEEIGQTLREHGRTFKGEFSATSATCTVGNQGLSEFQYIIEVLLTPQGAYPRAITRYERPRGAIRREDSFGGKRAFCLTKDDIGHHFVRAYLNSFKDRAGR